MAASAQQKTGRLKVEAFFLEYDGARSGGFAPLRFVPPGNLVVLLSRPRRPGR